MRITDKKENQILIDIESTSKDNEDSEELERITHNLRDELNELDAIEKVVLATKQGEQVPEGSKAGGEVSALGSLVVTLAASAASSIIPGLASTVQTWLSRHEKSKVSLEIGGDKIEVTGVSEKEQERLIDVWITRHLMINKNGH